MGVIYTGVAFVLLYGAIQKLPMHLAGALSFVYPIVAIGVDMVAFDHRLQPCSWPAPRRSWWRRRGSTSGGRSGCGKRGARDRLDHRSRKL
jgi:hypothetical protein